MKKKQLLIYVLVFLGLTILDQATKYIVNANMELGESIPIIPGFFQLLYVRNTGAGWSILEGQMTFFYIITVLAIIFFLYYFKTMEEWKKGSKLAVVIILAGIIGNFVDRLLLQYVVDFFSVNIFGYAFPVFNIADMCIVIGVGLIALEEFLIWRGVKTRWLNKDSK